MEILLPTIAILMSVGLACLAFSCRPGSLLSACLLLLLERLCLLRELCAVGLAAAAAAPARLMKLSNHLILSLDIAAHFNSQILLLRHAFTATEAA